MFALKVLISVCDIWPVVLALLLQLIFGLHLMVDLLLQLLKLFLQLIRWPEKKNIIIKWSFPSCISCILSLICKTKNTYLFLTARAMILIFRVFFTVLWVLHRAVVASLQQPNGERRDRVWMCVTEFTWGDFPALTTSNTCPNFYNKVKYSTITRSIFPTGWSRGSWMFTKAHVTFIALL